MRLQREAGNTCENPDVTTAMLDMQKNDAVSDVSPAPCKDSAKLNSTILNTNICNAREFMFAYFVFCERFPM